MRRPETLSPRADRGGDRYRSHGDVERSLIDEHLGIAGRPARIDQSRRLTGVSGTVSLPGVASQGWRSPAITVAVPASIAGAGIAKSTAIPASIAVGRRSPAVPVTVVGWRNDWLHDRLWSRRIAESVAVGIAAVKSVGIAIAIAAGVAVGRRSRLQRRGGDDHSGNDRGSAAEQEQARAQSVRRRMAPNSPIDKRRCRHGSPAQ